MFEALQQWFAQKGNYCSTDFPEVFHDFVDCFIDSVHARGPTAARPAAGGSEVPTFLPPVKRIVAVGDLHGDLSKARRAFRIGGLIDNEDRWIGGDTTAVQVGDQLDRGDQEVEILYWLERLQREAAAAGGALHVLVGNHETMNVAGRFTYATRGGFSEFYRWLIVHSMGEGLKVKCGGRAGVPAPAEPAERNPHSLTDSAMAARWQALAPGGAVTRRFLAPHPVVLQVGSNVFVHGGVLPEHADYGLEQINRETRDWMEGKLEQMPRFLAGRRALVWAREYSREQAEQCDCGALQQALSRIPGAQRMIVGHTIQDQGINSACGDRVFRIDVGMSAGCGDSEPEVLEILDDREVRRLRELSRPQELLDHVHLGGIRAWLRNQAENVAHLGSSQ